LSPFCPSPKLLSFIKSRGLAYPLILFFVSPLPSSSKSDTYFFHPSSIFFGVLYEYLYGIFRHPSTQGGAVTPELSVHLLLVYFPSALSPDNLPLAFPRKWLSKFSNFCLFGSLLARTFPFARPFPTISYQERKIPCNLPPLIT